MRLVTLLLFLFCYAYSILRYHIASDVPWSEWLFILNKGISWSAFMLVGASIIRESILEKVNLDRRALGINGFVFGSIHATISLLLLISNNEFIWKKLNSETTIFWSFLITGILSLLIYLIPLIGALKNLPKSSQLFRYGKIGFMINLFHPLLLGYYGWFTPSRWPWSLPPITLICVLSAMLFILFNKKKPSQE